MKKILLILLLFATTIVSAKVRFYDRTTYVEIRDSSQTICLTKGSGYKVFEVPRNAGRIQILNGSSGYGVLYDFYRSNCDTPSSTSVNNLITQVSAMLEASSGGGGDATAANQVTGNSTLSTLLKDSSIRNGHTNVRISGTVSSNSTQTGTWTVQPGNTANTTAWKVDGSSVTQPVSVSSIPTHGVTQSGSWTLASGSITTTNTGYWVTGYSYSHINTATTTNIATGTGVLHSITISKPGTSGVLTVYDNTSGAGTVIAVTGATTSVTLIYDLTFTTGLTIVSTFGVVGDITVTYHQ